MTDLTFRGYDRAALDAQYNNRLKVPDHAAQLARWPVDGERARATLSCRRDQPYGPGPGETVNVFPARGGTGLAPVLVFIHGGYWMAFDKSSTDFVALSMVPAGVAVVNVDYTLMPGVRMDVVVGQCRAAVGWVLANAASFGGDPSRVWVSGHSAGGHLTAAVAATDWAAQPGVPTGLRPAGGFGFSGLYDLEPIRLCYLNDTLAMDAAEARRNSPVLMPAPAGGDWTLWVGGAEGPEYLRQSVDLMAAWGTDGNRRVRAEVFAGENHFSIVAPLADPGSMLAQRMARTMGAAGRG
jgi:arylformamidase